MKKSTRIILTIVTILIGGAISWNLNTASLTGRSGALLGVVMVAVIAGIWRWGNEGENKN